MSRNPTFSGGVAEVGIRVGRLGRPVVTARRYSQRLGFTGAGDPQWEICGVMPERNAQRSAIPDMAIFLKAKAA